MTTVKLNIEVAKEETYETMTGLKNNSKYNAKLGKGLDQSIGELCEHNKALTKGQDMSKEKEREEERNITDANRSGLRNR